MLDLFFLLFLECQLLVLKVLESLLSLLLERSLLLVPERLFHLEVLFKYLIARPGYDYSGFLSYLFMEFGLFTEEFKQLFSLRPLADVEVNSQLSLVACFS